jgi:hypothetical protein
VEVGGMSRPAGESGRAGDLDRGTAQILARRPTSSAPSAVDAVRALAGGRDRDAVRAVTVRVLAEPVAVGCVGCGTTTVIILAACPLAALRVRPAPESGLSTASSSCEIRSTSSTVSRRSVLLSAAFRPGSVYSPAANSRADARVVSMSAAATADAADAPAGVELSRSTVVRRPVARHGRSRRSARADAGSANP